MECPRPAHSRAAHSMVSQRGAGLAWSSISDLGCNPPRCEILRDHEAPQSPAGGPALVSVIMKGRVPPSALLARPLLRAWLLGQNGRMDLGLRGRVYLVTGGSRGL